MIAKLIKEKSGYDLAEPPQFKECKPNPNTGMPSPFKNGFIKILDPSQWNHVAQAIKYFTIFDGTDNEGNKRIWECRALPYNKDLLGVSRQMTNKLFNVFVKDIPNDVTAADLDRMFSEKFGNVRSAKVSRSPQLKNEEVNGKIVKKYDIFGPLVSNGYGFVCFMTEEAVKMAVDAGKFNDFKIIKYEPKDKIDARRVFNNIYVKNFNPKYDVEQLKAIFGKYGEIKSCVVMQKVDKEGNHHPFSFICYERQGEPLYGPECAERAVNELHCNKLDDHTLYVQPALPLPQRQAQVARETTRFKNSKKKCNLFVKNFSEKCTKESLIELFKQFGEIESIKIIPSKQG